jgi:hypothetical protein
MLAPLLATLAVGGVHHADLNALFARQLPRVEAKTRIPVLMPDTMPTEIDPLYASSSATKKTYFLDLAGAPRCGNATACFEAEIWGQKGGTPFGLRPVRLAHGRHGRFKPLTCGGSCSPPSIAWKERGVSYTIQANVGNKKTERRILVQMANEAIRRGPR